MLYQTVKHRTIVSGFTQVREKSGNFELSIGFFYLKSWNFDIYPNMYSTYGYGSLLKIVVKKHS